MGYFVRSLRDGVRGDAVGDICRVQHVRSGGCSSLTSASQRTRPRTECRLTTAINSSTSAAFSSWSTLTSRPGQSCCQVMLLMKKTGATARLITTPWHSSGRSSPPGRSTTHTVRLGGAADPLLQLQTRKPARGLGSRRLHTLGVGRHHDARHPGVEAGEHDHA